MTDQPTFVPVWQDGDPTMEAIASAVWERCEKSDGSGIVIDDPRNIAAAAVAGIRDAARTAAASDTASDTAQHPAARQTTGQDDTCTEDFRRPRCHPRHTDDCPYTDPTAGQPAEAHNTDTSTWWTIQARKPEGRWFNLSEGFDSADKARHWRDTELQAANWPLRIVRVETVTVTVEDER